MRYRLSAALLALLLSPFTFGQSAQVNLSQLSHALQTGGIVPVSKGGTGLSTLPANGQILVSNGTVYTLGQLDLTLGVKNILPVANGGTGTATPGIVAGTNVTVTGTWPNQTVNSSGGGTPGGTNGQVQFNNSGAFGGFSLGTGVQTWLETPTLANLNAAISATLASISGAITTGDIATFASATTVSGLTVGSNTLVGSTGSGAAALTPAQAIGVLNSASADSTCTTATFTFTLSDSNGQVNCSDTVAQTVTIPANASVAFTVGTLLTVQAVGTGVVTLSPGSGVTITSAAYGSSTSQTYSLGGTYGFIQIQKTATDTWNVVAWDTPANQALAALPSEMQAYLKATTQWTGSGCTGLATTTGGPFAGTWTQPATACTTITVTLNGATGFTDSAGYSCTMGDETQTNAGTFIPTWIESSSTTTTAVFKIPAAAQVATDVLGFSCHPRSL